MKSEGHASLATRLTSERLVLRPPATRDVTSLRHFLRTNDAYLRPWSPAPPPGADPTSVTSVSRSITRQRREWRADRGFWFLAFERAKRDVVVGRVNLNAVVRGAFHNAYIGYCVAGSSASRGFTTEAVRAVLDFAFDAGRLHRVQAAIMPRNAPSHRVVEKLGFRKEGRAERYLQIAGNWEDHDIYAVTAEEWRARNEP